MQIFMPPAFQAYAESSTLVPKDKNKSGFRVIFEFTKALFHVQSCFFQLVINLYLLVET